MIENIIDLSFQKFQKKKELRLFTAAFYIHIKIFKYRQKIVVLPGIFALYFQITIAGNAANDILALYFEIT